jgi:nondiscriminating glutamyl-tRNA synthetase
LSKKMADNIKVRFAPSPTGPLHIGGARSALFNWLYVRRHGGTFIVRIEDTDLERSSRESEENILSSLRWLGVDWDEGIEAGGPNGPYRQTERLHIYKEYAAKLLEEGHVYFCYCSEEELAAQRESLLAKGDLPRYLGRCRELCDADRDRLAAEGRKPVLRFRVPEGKTINVNDQVRGEVSFETDGIGDFIIVKSDGIPTYNFAVVIDDHSMGISHVIRAEEHLSNTPRQVLIYQALGWALPGFAHISLILGSDHSKMSKRHGATSIEQYRALGYLPEAMVNFLALLGWSPGGEEEIFSLEEIKGQFSLDRVAKNPAVFDLEKLNWLNGHYIRHSDLERITALAIPFLQQGGYVTGEITPAKYQWVRMLVATLRNYLANMSEINAHVEKFFAEAVEPADEEAWEVLRQEQAAGVLAALRDKINSAADIDEETVRIVLKSLGKELGLKGKQIFMPLRVALTGEMHGPELYQVIPLLGREKTVKRLEDAMSKI